MRGRTAAVAVFVVLLVAHQDVWFWDDPSLVAGFLPIGLAWHAGFSVAAAALWAFVLRFAWDWEEGDA
jgi:hypothetical protein